MAARPYTAWRGAIEFAGFPVNVALYSRVRKARGQSFRMLAPNGKPVRQAWMDTNGDEVQRADCTKGVEVSPDVFVSVPAEAIDGSMRTETAPPAALAPLHSIDMTMAIDSFAVRPDDKVPGSGQAANIVWNALRANELAYVAQVTLRSGSPDGLLVLYATDTDFRAALLPFEAELYPVPEFEFVDDAAQAKLGAQVIEQQYEVDLFDHSAFKSEYDARRKAAIEAVIAGKVPEAPAKPEPKAGTDLMAALAASLEQAKPKAKAKPRKKRVAA